MELIHNGIENVRAVRIPAGVGAAGRGHPAVGRVLVSWRAPQSAYLYQVYVGGRFVGATTDSGQRRMLCPVPSSVTGAVRIEVFAVAADQADKDWSSQIAPAAAGDGRVRIRLLRRQSLPLGAEFVVYGDGGSGVIDYGTPLPGGSLPVWAGPLDKCGFGLAGFGAGDFGWDGSTAVGFGIGAFGGGDFGLAADVLEWISGPLEAGDYRFGVVVRDARGLASAPMEAGPVFVGPAATAVEELSLLVFDAALNRLELAVD